MKNKFFVLGMVFITGVLFCSSSPSLDGRAVVADPGTFPQGYFAKTVGYLPGDNINVTNPANGKQVDILVIGSLDPSEGVAILLSPEAANSLDVKKDSNNLVRLTKRTGQLDEAANGTAVLDDSATSAPAEKVSSVEKSAEKKNTVSEGKNAVETIPAETAGTGEKEAFVAAAEEPVSDPVVEDVVPAGNDLNKDKVPVTASTVESAEPVVEAAVPAAESFIAESHPDGYVETSPEANVLASPVDESFVADEMPEYVAAVPVVTVSDEAEDEPLEPESFSDDVVVPVEESFVAENIPDERRKTVPETEKLNDASVPVKGTPVPLAESFVAEDIPENTSASDSAVSLSVVGERSVEPESEAFEDEGVSPYEEAVTAVSESEEDDEEVCETVPAVVLVPVTASEPAVKTEKADENKASEESVVIPAPAVVEGRRAVAEEEAYDAIVLIPTDEHPPVSTSSNDIPVQNEIPVDEVPPENIALEIVPVEVADSNPVPVEDVVAEIASSSVIVEETVIGEDFATKETIRFVSSFNALEKKRYYVQIAVYGKTDNVKNVSDNYGRKYPLVCVSERNGTKNSVLVGPLNVDEYGTVLERFRSYGFKDAYLRFFK